MSSRRKRRYRRGSKRPGMIPATIFAPLKPVTGRPPIPTYLNQLWERRFFINAEAKAKAFASSRNMLLGNIWLLLGPLLDILMYGLIFGVILKTSRGVEHFVLFLVTGVILFRIISKDLSDGTGMIRAKRNVIKAFSFPRAAIILSHSLRTTYDSIPQLIILFTFILGFPGGPSPSWAWALFPALFLEIKVFSTGLMFLAAWSTHLIPDLAKIIQIFTRFWFYGSGVFFSIDRFVDQPTILRIMQANPAYKMLTAARDILIYDELPGPSVWTSISIWSFGCFLVGFLLFWFSETRYAKF